MVIFHSYVSLPEGISQIMSMMDISHLMSLLFPGLPVHLHRGHWWPQCISSRRSAGGRCLYQLPHFLCCSKVPSTISWYIPWSHSPSHFISFHIVNYTANNSLALCCLAASDFVPLSRSKNPSRTRRSDCLKAMCICCLNVYTSRHLHLFVDYTYIYIVYVCMYVRTYVCMYVCMYESM